MLSAMYAAGMYRGLCLLTAMLPGLLRRGLALVAALAAVQDLRSYLAGCSTT